MENLVRNMTAKEVGSMRLSADQFIELYNQGDVILLDIRYPFETDKWGLRFALEIPLNELPDRKDELPKDKLIICICPENFRSNIACLYLKSEGFNAKLFNDGLLGLTARLRGGAAKDLTLEA